MTNCISKILIIATFSISAFADVDKIEVLNGVQLRSGKRDDTRTYTGRIEKYLSFPIDMVKKGITNFSEKCNNQFKDKRKFTKDAGDCKYHNENLVESFVIKDIHYIEKSKNNNETYILGRIVYNRGSFGFYELVTIAESKNNLNQKTISISTRMLEDKEVKLYISPKFNKESAFDKSSTRFLLTEISPNETKVNYEYNASTDHWILNKEVSVPQVFASMSKSINDLIYTIEAESTIQKREVASNE